LSRLPLEDIEDTEDTEDMEDMIMMEMNVCRRWSENFAEKRKPVPFNTVQHKSQVI
jgi:hypothetical protein